MSKATNLVRKTSAQVKFAQNAGKLHDWPDSAGQCTSESWVIFADNQQQRSFEDWTPSDLFELARVSKLQAMAVEETDKLEEEGLLTLGGKTGMTLIENPSCLQIFPELVLLGVTG